MLLNNKHIKKNRIKVKENLWSAYTGKNKKGLSPPGPNPFSHRLILGSIGISGDPQMKSQGIECVFHEHGDGHGAYAPWYGRNIPSNLLGGIKIHIAL